MKFSPKLVSFQKKSEGQIRIQWRQIYSSDYIRRENNNFLQGLMIFMSTHSPRPTGYYRYRLRLRRLLTGMFIDE